MCQQALERVRCWLRGALGCLHRPQRSPAPEHAATRACCPGLRAVVNFFHGSAARRKSDVYLQVRALRKAARCTPCRPQQACACAACTTCPMAEAARLLSAAWSRPELALPVRRAILRPSTGTSTRRPWRWSAACPGRSTAPLCASGPTRCCSRRAHTTGGPCAARAALPQGCLQGCRITPVLSAASCAESVGPGSARAGPTHSNPADACVRFVRAGHMRRDGTLEDCIHARCPDLPMRAQV